VGESGGTWQRRARLGWRLAGGARTLLIKQAAALSPLPLVSPPPHLLPAFLSRLALFPHLIPPTNPQVGARC
jgi:hypothetical protein